MQHLVYLHGFLSSPQSEKAQLSVAYAKQHFPALNVHTPQLPGDVCKAVAIIDNLLATLPKGQVAYIGSSMGGYLSTYCVEKYGGKAVLVNPAVEPFHLLADYMGNHINPYTGEKFTIHSGHLDKLKSIYMNQPADPSAYKVLLQTEDETLDYRLAETKYTGADMCIEKGGNHSFIHYQAHLARIFAFLRG